MYILSGKVTCFKYDAETDQIVEKCVHGLHDFIFIPTLEVYGKKNEIDKEPVTFLCGITNVYEGENI